jgi:hypothetical protein
MTDFESSDNSAPISMSPACFEARELKLVRNPVLQSELREGSVYFCLSYVDADLLIPIMETVVYIGRISDRDGAPKLYFQDIDSYREGIRRDTPADENYATFSSRSENMLEDIFEYEQAIEELMRCSLRRRGI